MKSFSYIGKILSVELCCADSLLSMLLDSIKCTNKILTHIDIFEESLGNIMGFCSFYFWCI